MLIVVAALASGIAVAFVVSANVFPDQTWSRLTRVEAFRFQWRWNNSVSQKIAAEINSGATVVNMDQLADFQWDELFVFGPYAYPDAMCKRIKLSPTECSAEGFTDVDGEHFLLAFMNGRRVAKLQMFPRTIADFHAVCCWRGMTRGKVRFTVDREPSRRYLMCSE